MFYIGMGDSMACRGEGQNRTILRRNVFSILLDNSLVRATGIKPENLRKARTYLTSMSIPKQGKTNMNHKA